MSSSLAAAGATAACCPALSQPSSRQSVQRLVTVPARGSRAPIRQPKASLASLSRLAVCPHAAFPTGSQSLQVGAHRKPLSTHLERNHDTHGASWTHQSAELLSSGQSLGGGAQALRPSVKAPRLWATGHSQPITAARRDRRWPPWGRGRRERPSNSLGFALALLGIFVPVVLTSAGAVVAAVTIPSIAIGVAGVAVLTAMTTVLAVIGPLLLFFVPVFGLPVALLFGVSGFGFGGIGGAVRTVFDIILTLVITSNFVGALVSRAQKKGAAEPEEEKKVPIAEQIKWMAMAEVEKGLQDMRRNLPSSMAEQVQEKARKAVKKEKPEEAAIRKANEAQEALREVASVNWWGPTVISVVPGLNGLAWFAAADAFPSAVQGPRRSAYVRNALVYGAPALLYLLGAPFQGISALGFLRGEAWWLSLVFGLVHLQLERKDMVEEARARAQATALPEPDELERASAELLEFDRQLSKVAWSSEPPSKWTETQVGEWLQSEGLGRLVGAFAAHHIDGTVLLNLEGEELREELGITSLGDRKRVLAGIARLKAKELERDARVVKELDT